jgi:hypothetical protein
MARSECANLLRRLRNLIGDTAGTSQVWSDDDLQDALDAFRIEERYLPLAEQDTIAPGGAVSYLIFLAPCGDWDEAAQLVDNGYAVLSPATSDFQNGRWTFTTEPAYPVYLTGYTYDLNGAAAQILDQWAAQVKLQFSFSSGQQRFERQQQHAMLTQQAALCRRKQRPRCVPQIRGDVR